MKALLTIDWRITGICNERCPFCYGPDKSINPSSEVISKIASVICTGGFKVLRFSGGEPLLVPNLLDVIHKVVDHNMDVVLSTNGVSYLTKHQSRLDSLIRKLNLSLDGYDIDSHHINGRRSKSFLDVIEILEYYKLNPPEKFSIKIGTIVTSKNASLTFLLKMYNLIKKYDVVDRWKIYQYIPEGPIIDHDLCVDNKLFLELESRFFQEVSHDNNRNLTIVFSSIWNRDKAYLIVQPYGDVFIPQYDGKETQEILIGNLLKDDMGSIIKRWFDVGGKIENHVHNNSVLGNGKK